MTFKMTDPADGIVLVVEPSNQISCACRVRLEDPSDDAQVCLIVPQARIRDTAAGIAAAMYEAAGFAPPVILERPEGLPEEAVTEVASGIEVGRSWNPCLPVMLSVRSVCSHITPETARDLAASLTAHAGAAEADTGRRDLCDLASLVLFHGSAEEGRRAARAILATYELTERAL
jgi:hypothetical protein